MGYDYLLTLFKVLLGLVTSRRLIYIALISFGLYLLWVILALVFSFQRRFYTKSLKMYNFLKKGDNLADKRNFIDKFADKLSAGFANGWQRFCRAERGKPSRYISRKESLDSEVNGGVFNQGKSIMRFYIWLTTILLLIFNLAYHGGESVVTFTLFAECAMFPVIYFVILKIFYFLYTIVRQQLYKLDIEAFYDLVTELDNNFGTTEPARNEPVATTYDVHLGEAPSEENSDEPEEVAEEQETAQSEMAEEPAEQETAAAEDAQPEEGETATEENELDKYDVFKKKNIDVASLINEVPNSSKTLPFINVDSSYVIGDEGETAAPMTANENFESGEGETESAAETEENVTAETENETEVLENEDVKPELGEEENISAQEAEDDSTETEPENEPIEAENTDTEFDAQTENIDETESVSAESSEEPVEDNLTETSEEPVEAENETEPSENIGEINEIEEESHESDEAQTHDGADESVTESEEKSQPKLKPIIYDSTTINLDDFEINTADEVAEKSKQNENKSNFVLPGEREEQESGSKIERRRPQRELTETEKIQTEKAPTEEIQAEESEPKITKREPKKSAEKKAKPQPKPETKQADKAKRNKKSATEENSVKKEIKENNMAELKDQPAKRRGRPKKQIFDENVSITSDEEFDEVLSRAEKLMRKSEEGLSSSQSKRIEKELKMLIDAMNKYKENK